MGYIENRLAIFYKHADKVFKEQVTHFQEKETYLNGTKFLRLRVLNNLAEVMKTALRTEIQIMLTECNKEAPEDYDTLKTALEKVFEQYVSRFRNNVLN